MTQPADTSEKTPTSNIAKHHPKKYQRILTGFFLLLAITGAIYFAIQFYKLNNMKPSTSGKLRFGALTGLASSLFIVSILFLVINLTAELTVKKICKNWMKIQGTLTPLAVGSTMLIAMILESMSPEKMQASWEHQQIDALMQNHTSESNQPESQYVSELKTLNYASPTCFIIAGILKLIALWVSDDPNHPLQALANFALFGGAAIIGRIDVLNNEIHDIHPAQIGLGAAGALGLGSIYEAVRKPCSKLWKSMTETQPLTSDPEQLTQLAFSQPFLENAP